MTALDTGAHSPLWNKAEAAAYLRIGVRTLEEMIAKDVLPPIRIGGRCVQCKGPMDGPRCAKHGMATGGRIFFTKEMLDAWLARKTPLSPSPHPPIASAPRTAARSSTSDPGTIARASPSSSPSSKMSDRVQRNVERLTRPRKRSLSS